MDTPRPNVASLPNCFAEQQLDDRLLANDPSVLLELVELVLHVLQELHVDSTKSIRTVFQQTLPVVLDEVLKRLEH